jgi:hypothetical protein
MVCAGGDSKDLSLLCSINAAGGFSSLANKRKVRLLRENKGMIIDVTKFA